jgi:hypothetical protein
LCTDRLLDQLGRRKYTLCNEIWISTNLNWTYKETISNVCHLLKGKKQQMDLDDGDWDEEGRNDVVDVMENEEPEKVVLPMQPIALEVAREDMERLDALRRE